MFWIKYIRKKKDLSLLPLETKREEQIKSKVRITDKNTAEANQIENKLILLKD